MRQSKRWLTLLLVAMMLLSALPVSAMAAGEEPVSVWNSMRVYNSLLEEETDKGDFDLTFVSEAKLKAYPVEDILSALDISTPNGETIVAWGTRWDDYKVVKDGKIDFSEMSYGSFGYIYSYAYFVVGESADQLSKGNKLYRTYVQRNHPGRLLEVKSSVNVTKGDGVDLKADGKIYYDSYDYRTYDGQRYDYLQIEVDHANYASGDQVQLTLALKDPYGSDYSAEIYKGAYESAEAAEAAGAENLTEEFFNTGHMASYDKGVYDQDVQPYTLMLKDSSGGVVYQTPFFIYMVEVGEDAGWDGRFYKDASKTRFVYREDYYLDSSIQTEDGNRTYYTRNYKLYAELAGTVRDYYVRLSYQYPNGTHDEDPVRKIARAVSGYYRTEAEINAQPDIKEQLFFGDSQNGGYRLALGATLTVTVLDTDGNIFHESVKLSQGDKPKTAAPSDDTPDDTHDDSYFFAITGAMKADGSEYHSYIMKQADDSSYRDGYQTAFLLDDSSAIQVYGVAPDTVAIRPTFDISDGAKAYASQDGVSATEQTSGESEINFQTPVTVVPYSVRSASGREVGGTSWVTFATQYTGGAYLFVNGATGASTVNRDASTGNAVRKVVLDDAHDNHHDIFFANIGNEELTGITATLNASGVKLDDYWKIGETKTLDAFDNIQYPYITWNRTDQYNVGKLRLVPADESSFASVSGTLTISSDNGGSETIKLTGIAGQPKILTKRVVAAVKYVPYSSIIQTNYSGDNVGDALTFSLSSGSLPTGLALNARTGEIYGVPTAVETKTFTVKITGKGDFASYTDTATFTMEVKSNTAANVEATTSTGYEFVNNERVPNMSSYTKQLFHSNGALSEFQALYLDGERLTEGTDYTAEDGSTKITIEAQTFSKKGNGEHTLSAEFRTGGSADGEMKVTSQNYTANVGSSGNSGRSGRSSSSDREPPRDITPSRTTPSTTDSTPVEVKYEVSGGEAAVAALSDSEISRLAERATNGKIVLDLNDPARPADAVLLPRATVDKLVGAVSKQSNDLAAAEIRLSSATLDLDDSTLEAVSNQAQGETVKLSLEEITAADLNGAQREALEGMEVEKISSAEVSSNGAAISDFNGGRMTMSVPFTVPAGRDARDYAAYYVAPDGRKVLHSCELAGGFATIRTAHCSEFAIVYEPLKKHFVDVPDGAWYTSLVDYAARAGLMSGVSPKYFGTYAPMTRAMFAQILCNLENGAAERTDAFRDVPAEKWYSNAVNWAAEQGILSGVTQTRFAPEDNLTREQMVTALYKYARYKGYDVSQSAGLSRFADGGDVEVWARDAMSWAIANKLINGVSKRWLEPGEETTRAQAAKLFASFFEEYAA